MSLAIAIQMDPIESIDIDADSTFVIGLEAQRRGHRLFTYQPKHLTLRHDRLVARGWDLTLERVRGAHFQLGEPRTVDLADMDVVLLRQDPPFDLAYITTTHLLEHLPQRVLVLNDPAEVRNAPEKLLVTHFPQLMPPSLITCERGEIEDFRTQHQDIIIKPLFGCGGAGVFHLKPDDENLTSILELFTRLYPHEPVMVQRYLSAIRDGDKRIILVEGEPVGAVSRMPQSGEARANFHSGGQPRKTELTDREREICAAIGPLLHRKGLVFTGIDVIGDWLTEINVTSPTGIQQINRLDGVQLEVLVVDALEARLAARRALS
jgi:glutathione synthase